MRFILSYEADTALRKNHGLEKVKVDFLVDDIIKAINDSKTHRVVAAPDNHEFLGEPRIGYYRRGDKKVLGAMMIKIALTDKPDRIFDPIFIGNQNIFVGDVYPNQIVISDEWDAKFGWTHELYQAGYTHFIPAGEKTDQHYLVFFLHPQIKFLPRICLKKRKL